MTELQKKALENSLKLLTSLGCVYAIIDAEGNKFGLLEVKPQKTRKRNLTHPWGERKNYLLPFIENIQVGESVVVPIGNFTRQQIQTSLSAMMHYKYGKGNYMSSYNDEKQTVELLRLA